uniref:Uncharacterized protein n=1 Tax=Rhizophora mucronata TaxID=61149 RepID=A0A2P2PNG5_RHIMU
MENLTVTLTCPSSSTVIDTTKVAMQASHKKKIYNCGFHMPLSSFENLKKLCMHARERELKKKRNTNTNTKNVYFLCT